MFGNFLEETCTGTGATLALAGVTTGNIVFSERFSDGDLVAYVVEDSGGTIKVGGVGLYVSATDDITRDDTWNWNGTVYDSSPTTNITLSGGTHTVRCDLSGSQIPSQFKDGVPNDFFIADNCNYQQTGGKSGGEFSALAGRLTLTSMYFRDATLITDIGIDITASSAAGDARIGLYECNRDGTPGNLIADSGNLATDATGPIYGTLGSPVTVSGYVFHADYADNTTVTTNGIRQGTAGLMTGGRQGTDDPSSPEKKKYYDLTYGAFPATLGTPDGTTGWATLSGIFR